MKIIAENGMYAVVAAPGMVIDHGDGYCHKLYRKTNDFEDCAEVDASVVPVDDEITDAEALAELMEVLE